MIDEHFNIYIQRIYEMCGQDVDQNLFSKLIVFSKDYKKAKYGIIGKIEQIDDMHYNEKRGTYTEARITPLLDEMHIIIPEKDKKTLYLIGRIDDIWSIYQISNLNYNSKKNSCKSFKLKGNFDNYEKISDEIFIIKTDEGSFLFNMPNMKVISDTFDVVTTVYNGYPPYIQDDKILCEKEYHLNGYDVTICGTMDTEGKISDKLFSFCPTLYFDTPLEETEEKYDVLDDIQIYKVIIDKMLSFKEDDKKRKK